MLVVGIDKVRKMYDVVLDVKILRFVLQEVLVGVSVDFV